MSFPAPVCAAPTWQIFVITSKAHFQYLLQYFLDCHAYNSPVAQDTKFPAFCVCLCMCVRLCLCVCVCVCSGIPLHVHLFLLTSINSSKYPAACLLLQELHWFIAFNFSGVADSRQAFILTWLRFLKSDNILSLNLPSLCSLLMVHVFHACVLWNLSTPYRRAFLYTSQT